MHGRSVAYNVDEVNAHGWNIYSRQWGYTSQVNHRHVAKTMRTQSVVLVAGIRSAADVVSVQERLAVVVVRVDCVVAPVQAVMLRFL